MAASEVFFRLMAMNNVSVESRTYIAIFLYSL